VKKNKNIAANNLLQAMKDGDIKKIKELLKSGVDLESTIDSITFLTYAVMIGNIDLIYLLIESGANINQRCENSLTPLAHAAVSGAFKEFKYLSDAGADFGLNYTIIINGAQSIENSLLMLAVVGGSLEICKHISENQTEIEKANASGITPLLASLHWEKADIFNYLLSVGANPDPECLATGLASLEWMTPLMVAAAKGSAVSVKALVNKGADVNRTVGWGPSALKLAVISGDIGTIKEVLDAGALVDIIDMEGWTPLMNAATEGSVEITKLLVARGANPNHIVTSNLSSKTDGRTSLMNAAFNGHVEVAQVLLNAGASVNVETPLGASALSFAIQARVRSSELLSVTSILPDSFESKDEAYEFHDDLLKRSLEVIKVLIAQGADITCRVEGINAVIYVRSLQDKEMLQHFEKMDASVAANLPNDSKVISKILTSHWEVIRSRGARDQMSAATLLMHKVISDLTSIKSKDKKVLKNIESLISAINLSQESFDPIFERREPESFDKGNFNWTYSDRTSSMVSGPFYTSKKYPRDRSWMPIVQVDLCELTKLKNINFGEGLLQIWYPICADPDELNNEVIVVIPKSEIGPNLLTPWKFFYDPSPCGIDISPIPSEWGSFFWPEECETHVIKGVVSRGIRCPDGYIRDILQLLQQYLSKELNDKIIELIDICKFNYPTSPKGEIIVLGLFGTFQFDRDSLQPYNAGDVGMQCLLNMAWDGDGTGQAQLFFYFNEKNIIEYKFKDFWGRNRQTQEMRRRDKSLYMGETFTKAQKRKSSASIPAANKSATNETVRTKTAKKKVLAEIQPENDFRKLMTPSADLAAVVGDQPMARTEVVRQLWIYIKKYNLQDSKNKRNINADARLKAVFGKEEVSMFEMTSLIEKHLS
jgi:upstream activation factor subunit UAF30